MLVRQDPRHVAEQPVAVEGLDLELTRKTLADDGAHSTSMSRSGFAVSWVGVGAVDPVHRHPAPRVTNPMMGSPGTGVQHFASFTQTSAVPTTTTPGRRHGVGRARVGTVASAMSSVAPSTPRIEATTLPTTCCAGHGPHRRRRKRLDVQLRRSVATAVMDSWLIRR